MIHLLMAIFFIVCLLGIVSTILAYLVYKQRKEQLFKCQSLFLTTVLFYSVIQFVVAYGFFARLILGYFLMMLFSNFLMSPLLYLAFSFAYLLVGVEPSKVTSLLMIIWALFYPLVFVIWIWQHVFIVYTPIYMYSPFLIFLVILNVLFRRYREIINPEIKKFTRNTLILIVLFIPLIVLEMFIRRYLQPVLYYPFPVIQLFFIGYNFVNLSFLIRVFLRSPLHTVNSAPDLPQWFYEKNNLTKREQEVLSLLQRRYSNREIADRLFISIPTVKFHIQNIFFKIGVNDRVELLRFLEKILNANQGEDNHQLT